MDNLIGAVQTQNNDIIIMTETAKQHFSNIVKSKDALGVRLGLYGGGCAGFMYTWDIVKDKSEADLSDPRQDFGDFVFFLQKEAATMLVGSTVDYEESIWGSGIKITTLRDSVACGCGESVTFKE